MATISIADNDARIQHSIGSGGNTPDVTQYTIDFPFFSLDDINVIITSSGTDTTLTRGTGAGTFAVTGTTVDDGFSGGYITLGSAYTSVTLTIIRDIAISRTSDFATSGPFNISSLNTDLDKIYAVMQQLETKNDRALTMADSDDANTIQLPNKANRIGTVLAFNATTGDAEPGPSIGSVTTVASQSANINTLAGIDSDITTVSGISSNVTTVAGISSNVTTVAGISSDVTAVAGDATDIGTVATNIASVNTVATNIADVITVANDLNEAVSEVVTVADDLNEAISEIDTVAGSISNVDSVGTNIANVNTVAGIISNVTTVAGISGNVTTVAGISGNVTTVAGISSDVTTVATDGTDIGTVATNITNVNTVAGVSVNVTTVAGISANVTTVAGISSDVTTVAGDSTAINTVANDATDIGTVATNIANVNSVGGSIVNVNTVASNLASVNNFADVYRIASSAPTSSLDIGDLYFDTTSDTLKVYGASGWQSAGSSINGTSQRYHYDITGTPTSVTGADANGNTLSYDAGYVDVYVNGVRMSQADVTVTSGDTVTFAQALADGDEVDIVGYGTFAVASLNADNLDSGTVPDARITGAYTGITNLTMSGNLTVDTNTLYVDSANNSVGIGTTDIVNNSGYNSLRLGSAGNLQAYTSTTNGNIFISEGAAINSAGNWEYLRSDFATYYRQGDGTHIWASSASGIDGNTVSFSERMRIDSSGNLLVGKTSYGSVSTDGTTISPTFFQTSATDDRPMLVNLNGDDGNLIEFLKAGAAVGSIGTFGSALYFASPDGTDAGLRVGNSTVVPVTTTGALRDNAIDLGSASARWNNLYLSGGVYLGGTGSANFLDDYEEGSFTPSWSGGGGPTHSVQVGRYTKIGNRVIANLYILISNKSTMTGAQTITGLPFTSENTSNNFNAVSIWMNTMDGGSPFNGNQSREAFQEPNTTKIKIYAGNGSGGQTQLDASHLTNTTDVMLTVSYNVS
jgi:hypothetical protein